ncbi:MAG: hypothetical protein ACRDCZ_00245, partial [Culicoidibacterales bacterium]
MVKAPQSHLNYLFFKISLLITSLILILAAYMAVVNYKLVVGLHLANYRQMLSALDKSYLKKLINS